MILILGKHGQVGSNLALLAEKKAIAVDRNDADLLDKNFIRSVDALYEKHHFTTIINAAAYTQVDKAEQEHDAAMLANGYAVGMLADWCKARGVVLVHYSTDYVFDGSGSEPRKEDARTHPLSIYGKSKLLGEEMITASGAKHLIFRTSWVYDAQGNNFFNSMRRLFKEREEINVVADQIGAPTYAPSLAAATLGALAHAEAMEYFPSGIYHLCGGGEASWYDFACAILALATQHESGIKCKRVNPISTEDYPTPTQRPLNSRLDCTKAKTILQVGLAPWQAALEKCYECIRLRD